MKITKNKIGGTLAIILVLALAYIWGGGYAQRPEPLSPPSAAAGQEQIVLGDDPVSEPGEDQAPLLEADAAGQEAADNPVITSDTGTEPAQPKSDPAPESKKQATEEKKITAAAKDKNKSSPGVKKGSETYSEKKGMTISPDTGKDKYLTDPVPEGKPIPVEPQNAVVGEKAYTCTLSVECSTILDNIKVLDKNKLELVPENGIIFPPTKVTFYEGESVFNVLQREMKKNKIHMEFENTPIYNSAYIEGINNLYEFDCGELSGWMFKVNDWFPNYGSSRYQLKNGDVVEWVYTCDLGRDIGGHYASGSQ
ncbi:MAG: DUF4430 domain-containing protein [Dehalobacterium sp.]|jgi:hypothetical protein